MLAEILERMHVEPEVLELLSEEQKKILFQKMRQEQLRRWREREQEEEREGCHKRPKKASSKQVKWLLRRDGEVSVTVIGELDEFRSSKVLQNHMNNRFLSDSRNCNQTADLLPGSDNAKLPLADVNEHAGSPINQSSVEEGETEGEKEEDCSVDEDPKDPHEDSNSESGGGSVNLIYRSHFHGCDKPQQQSKCSDTKRVVQQDREALWCREKSENEGRPPQRRKAFSDKLSACNKPPLPVKPAHLQKRGTALVH